jgi:TonB family protein
MNTSPVHLIGIGVLLAGSLLAQPTVSSPEWQSMKIQETVEPIFPPHLLQIGINRGRARVAVDTDANGKLVEWLVLGYTHQAFADAAVVAIKQWKFEPARLRGEPAGTIVDLDFDFSVSGIVVSNQNVTEATEALLQRLQPDRFTDLPCAAQDLDRVPTPLVTVAPRYPIELAKRGIKGTVRISFYIDQTGAVRLPSVPVHEDSELTEFALDALNQWKFTPPTSHGRPVLARATEDFNFGGS